MTMPISTGSSCYTLQHPPTEKDDRLNLHVRTGAAATLHNSFVFIHGGLTIGLELDHRLTIEHIRATFALRVTGGKLRRLHRYFSGELFSLDLISRCWHRVEIVPDSPHPTPRIFHELVSGRNCLYVFGGLVAADDATDSSHVPALVPCNDLWQFCLFTKLWTLLHDGSNWQTDSAVPSPRYAHKMTLICSLVYANRKDHHGLIIAGGRGADSAPLYDNFTFDMIDKKYVGAGAPLLFAVPKGDDGQHSAPTRFQTAPDSRALNVNYQDSTIVSFANADGGRRRSVDQQRRLADQQSPAVIEERNSNQEIIIYAPTKDGDVRDPLWDPLLAYRVGKKLGQPRQLLLHMKGSHKQQGLLQVLKRTVPHNLRFPTAGIFGQNLVLVGFLPHEYEALIFIYNKPTGKWLRLNVLCSHEYGAHQLWGGFVWLSHHKVVLLGNAVTSRSSSSMRYFSLMFTVSLPVMNILTSLELAGGHLPRSKPGHRHGRGSYAEVRDSEVSGTETDLLTMESETLTCLEEFLSLLPLDTSDSVDELACKLVTVSTRSDSKKVHKKATFKEYVHYAAPKVKFTNVRSVFTPAAMTLGRNAFDRYGDCISDFELVSCTGDRIPVCLSILMERWGKYFVDLFARAYVRAIDQFERDQIRGSLQSLRVSKGSDTSDASDELPFGGVASDAERGECGERPAERSTEKYQLHISVPRSLLQDTPQFRLPFQDKSLLAENLRESVSVDPHNAGPERRASAELIMAGPQILIQHLRHIPAQPPLPTEPLPDVPASQPSYRSSLRSNSADTLLPLASVHHTLSVLRNISRSPKGSPFLSPRNSVSVPGDETRPKQAWNKRDAGDVEHVTPQRRHSLEGGMSPLPRRVLANEWRGSPLAGTDERRRDERRTESRRAEDPAPRAKRLLEFEALTPDKFQLEPSLVPRKLYIPFGTSSLKAFAEFFYTGQVGNKWVLRPCTLDCLLMARYFKVPLLYDLICEVLYGIVGRKEALVVKEGQKYKRRFMELFARTQLPPRTGFRFPLDEFEGFLDTIDDGFLDLALLRKLSNVHKLLKSTSTSKRASPVTKGSDDVAGMMSPKLASPASRAASASDDTSDDISDDDPAVSLYYLDAEERAAVFGLHAKLFDKSAFDERELPDKSEPDDDDSRERALLCTLESLVSPDAPEPSNYIIDIIYETASMCTDVKLMLRSMNARQMGLALEQTKRDYRLFVEAMGLEKGADAGVKNADMSQFDPLVVSPEHGTGEQGRPLVILTKPSPAMLLHEATGGAANTGLKHDKSIHENADWSDKSGRRSSVGRSGIGSLRRPLALARLQSEVVKPPSSSSKYTREEKQRSESVHEESGDAARDTALLSDVDDSSLLLRSSSRTSRGLIPKKLRSLTEEFSGKVSSPEMKRSESTASSLSLSSRISTGKRNLFGIRRKK